MLMIRLANRRIGHGQSV